MNLLPVDIMAACAAVLAVWMCGVSRIQSGLWGLALQTLLLAAITATIGIERHIWHYLILAGVVLAVKAIAIPWYLSWATRRLDIRRDAGLLLNPTWALLCGCSVLATGYFLAPQIAVLEMQHSGAAGMSMAILLIGMLLMITRRLALSQIIGFLVLENGIFLYGLTQTQGMPLMVEMGVIFDVLVGVLIAGLVIFRLNRSFEHIDVTQLRGLRH